MKQKEGKIIKFTPKHKVKKTENNLNLNLKTEDVVLEKEIYISPSELIQLMGKEKVVEIYEENGLHCLPLKTIDSANFKDTYLLSQNSFFVSAND